MMTIRDFIKKVNEEETDIDVCGDLTDDWAIAYCGDKTMSLTAEGEKEFGEVLALNIDENTGVIQLNCIKDDKEAERLNQKASRFFHSLGGYCSSYIYDRWFNFGEEQEFEITVRQYRDRTVKVKATCFGKARDKAIQIADDMTDWDSVDHYFMTADEDGIMGED